VEVEKVSDLNMETLLEVARIERVLNL